MTQNTWKGPLTWGEWGALHLWGRILTPPGTQTLGKRGQLGGYPVSWLRFTCYRITKKGRIVEPLSRRNSPVITMVIAEKIGGGKVRFKFEL